MGKILLFNRKNLNWICFYIKQFITYVLVKKTGEKKPREIELFNVKHWI